MKQPTFILEPAGPKPKPDLKSAPATAPVPVSTTGTVEYTVGGELWKCEEFELLAAEFGLRVEQLPAFHALATLAERGWAIVRRLFGLAPVLLPANASPEDYGRAGRQELLAMLGLSEAELRAELDGVRGLWRNQLDREEVVAAPDAPAAAVESPDAILREHGFSQSMFLLPDRPPEDARMEKEWFVNRVLECRRELKDRNAGELVRRRLLMEMDLRRCDEEKPRYRIASAEYERLVKRSRDLANDLKETVVALDKLFPWTSEADGRGKLTMVLSTLIAGLRDARAKGDYTLLNNFQTFSEIQVDLRQSVQAPNCRHRFGLTVAIAEARAGLMDPEFRRRIPFRILKKLDAGFAAGVEAVRQETNEALPDLEADGPGSEYDPLQALAEIASEGDVAPFLTPAKAEGGSQNAESADGGTRD